jgi:hypothetical protein
MLALAGNLAVLTMMKGRRVTWHMRSVVLTAAMLALAAAGCTSGQGSHATAAPGRLPLPGPSATLTGVTLSALIPTPAGFTLDPSASYNSGSHEVTPVPGASDASAVSCASWWAGKGSLGPGMIGYAIKSYTGPDQVELHLEINLYPPGAAAKAYDLSLAVQRRCSHFTYQDVNGQHYLVSAVVGPSAGIGDRSQEINATETSAGGTVFRTETTFILVSDAMVTANETGIRGVPVDRAPLPLAAIVASLRSAG